MHPTLHTTLHSLHATSGGQEMSRILRKSEFAALIGVDRAQVTRWGRDDRLVLDDRGRGQVEATARRVLETEPPGKAGKGEAWARGYLAATGALTAAETASGPQAVAKASEADTTAETPSEPPAESYSAARARREHYAALTAKLDYERAVGKLCETAAVKFAGMDAGARVRAALEQLPDQLAPELAAAGSEERIHALLVEHVEMLLEDLAHKLERAVSRVTEDAA